MGIRTVATNSVGGSKTAGVPFPLIINTATQISTRIPPPTIKISPIDLVHNGKVTPNFRSKTRTFNAIQPKNRMNKGT
jgi:hypothetical protein